MREIAPTRKRALFHNLKASQIKHPAPIMFCLKRAWASAAAPLPVVCPTDQAVPPDRRNVFIDNRLAAISQHSGYFVEHEPGVMRVMQNIAEQHCVEALVFDRKMPAVVRKVVDASGGAVADVQADHRAAEHALKMVRDETVAAAHVENVGIRRQHSGDFKRHVVSSSDLAASAHSLEATFDGCG
jgi:hypothetical protein